MSLVFEQHVPSSFEEAPPSRADVDGRPTVWDLVAPRYSYSLSFRYARKGGLGSAPARKEHWHLGLVQNVIFLRVRVRYGSDTVIEKAFGEPMLDCTSEAARPFIAPAKRVERTIPGIAAPGAESVVDRHWIIAAWDFDYGPAGIEVAADKAHLLSGGPEPPPGGGSQDGGGGSAADGGSSASSDTVAQPLRTPLANPTLPMKMVDQPRLSLSSRRGRSQLMRADMIVVMRFWVVALRPQGKRELLVGSDPFTLGTWLAFEDTSDSKSFDLRDPSWYGAGFAGDLRGKLTANILDLERVKDSDGNKTLHVRPNPRFKPVTSGRLANDVVEDWYRAQGFVSR